MTGRSLSPSNEPLVPDHPHLQALNAAISDKALPCSSGAFPVKSEDLVLYYGLDQPNSPLGRIDFSTCSEEDVKRLAASCQPASFGRGNVNVHDESYRKAVELDKSHFAATFDPEQCGLMHAIRPFILEGHGSSKTLRSELYKLNVYGPGSFFKAHKDTPRADNMIASLVVVLPTVHEGGTLVFRHESREFQFDSAKAVAESTLPSVAYAAFYGDVEHEVEPVVSGYRVTLTYNLYLIDYEAKGLPEKTPYECALKDAFRTLIQDEDYLPEGGLIGFGLRHEYPVDLSAVKYSWGRGAQELTPIEHLIGSLKGSDAILQKVCRDLSLKASLRMVYYGEEHEQVMTPGAVPIQPGEIEIPITNYLIYEAKVGKVIRPADYDYGVDLVVHWATPLRPRRDTSECGKIRLTI